MLPAHEHFGSLEQHIHLGTAVQSAWGTEDVSKHPGIFSAGAALGFENTPGRKRLRQWLRQNFHPGEGVCR